MANKNAQKIPDNFHKKNLVEWSVRDQCQGVGIVKGWAMYQEIQQLRELGLNKSQAARKLGIDRRTVSKYWEVTPDEFAQLRQKAKRWEKGLDRYERRIVGWLMEYPDISAAQIHDWLKEHYRDYHGKERTLRRYIKKLREQYGITKHIAQRQYEAVDELPMGYQAQVDLGQIVLKNTRGELVRLYGVAMVLSHSRYKYVEWSDKPFTTAGFIQVLYRAMEFIGGVPKEIVFDQDRLLTVNENFGDVIYTAEFERFRQNMGFRVYLCRKDDPESKGKIEAVIKYAKRNYARYRVFDNIRGFNEGCIEWLERTGNANIHGATKKVPAEVFAMEKEHLKPIPILMNQPENSLTRQVRKDNTVIYQSNRYTVPLGTYRPGRQVILKEKGETIEIIDEETGEVLAQHRLCVDKGRLIANNNHRRDRSQGIDRMRTQALVALGETESARLFLDGIRKEKPRYTRDQYQLILSTVQKHSPSSIAEAVDYCAQKGLYSAVEFRTAVEYFESNRARQASCVLEPTCIPLACRIKTEVRKISEYASIYGGMHD